MVIDIFNTDKKYDIIYADPPWSYRDKMKMKGVHGEIRGAASFYDTMDLSDIKSLPIKSIAKENSILTYKTCGFCWIKRTKNGKIHLGLGHYTRGNAELCLIGIMGKKPTFLTRSLSQIVESEIRSHSQKPDIVRDKIVELVGDLPKIELFARQQVEGWDCWGNEV